MLAFFFLMASLASAVLWTTASRAAGEAPKGPAPTVIVQPDDTLWSIAERVAPDRAPREVIDEIRNLNNIKGSYVYAGDTLLVPRED